MATSPTPTPPAADASGGASVRVGPGTRVRRGLPRTPGGEPWPPGGDAPHAPEQALAGAMIPEPAILEQTAPEHTAPKQTMPEQPPRVAATVAGRSLRRGLPRTPGGEPWPPAGAGVAAVAASSAATQPEAPEPAVALAPAAAEAVSRPEATPPAAVPAEAGRPLRRGLPRTPGGEPWPPAGAAPLAAATAAEAVELPVAAEVAEPAPAAPASLAVVRDVSVPLPFTPTVFPGRNAFVHPQPKTVRRHGPFTTGQWVGAAIVAGAGLLFAAGMLVLLVRWFLSLTFMQDFMHAFPGQYALPGSAPVGFPAWLGWQHFFNVFFMVLIIRTGLTVRHQKRPTAFWSPRGNPKRKISLSLWFHQSLDILWIVNGVIFIVLLFTTGQWMRIVPTSWEVFPNALTAALKYVSLNWPTEDGWVNYNSLQQLAYFATVFLAAPLAIVTGVRMSGVWPKNAKGLNRAYPIEAARAVHFPVMLYFCLFILVHVALVLATGALRNLNHMYGGSDQVNWVGFWIFVASLAVISAAWAAARPLVLAPIARLFGTVSGR